jgi:hypothetical protein
VDLKSDPDEGGGEADAEEELGSGRLTCCGWEPDPTLVTVLLAQLIHAAVGLLLWMCFWRRLCVASFCYGVVMLHSAMYPANIVPAVDYVKAYLGHGNPGLQYLEKNGALKIVRGLVLLSLLDIELQLTQPHQPGCIQHVLSALHALQLALEHGK